MRCTLAVWHPLPSPKSPLPGQARHQTVGTGTGPALSSSIAVRGGGPNRSPILKDPDHPARWLPRTDIADGSAASPFRTQPPTRLAINIHGGATRFPPPHLGWDHCGPSTRGFGLIPTSWRASGGQLGLHGYCVTLPWLATTYKLSLPIRITPQEEIAWSQVARSNLDIRTDARSANHRCVPGAARG
ncbi:hypothetical protein BO71DRAFT_402691 [Aspergillus ellipticus CBS 707.79]|uniref:Uncharacterized protein n=1 Tax=Aspergillus ellipticus CBS 707.79 TaxID=1448320 RepID=A0A319CYR3_9EURO|nr:hypothetical protein BO71DRAFT_402691 [Aspergillus ellipticus CBS 707.79]